MEVDYTSLPLPPPWRLSQQQHGLIETGGAFVNELTGEVTDVHPFLRLLELRRLREERGNSHSPVPQTKDVGVSVIIPAPPEGRGEETGMPGRPYVSFDQTGGGGRGEELGGDSSGGTNQLFSNGEFSETKQQHPPQKQQFFSDFRCIWKELGLFGDTKAYGLVIRYFEDGQTIIKFDGLDGKWHYSQLEGQYGPIERYDLFIGARVKVFGRHLTVSATSASTCHWIDIEGKKLQKHQEWLQAKIESVGAVPLVRRQPPTAIKHIVRASKSAGNTDLRRLANENARLSEQIANLGLGSSVPMVEKGSALGAHDAQHSPQEKGMGAGAGTSRRGMHA